MESDACYRVHGWRHLVKDTEEPEAWLKVMAVYRRVDGLKSPAG